MLVDGKGWRPFARNRRKRRVSGSSPLRSTKLVVTLPKGSERVVGSISANAVGPLPEEAASQVTME